MKMQRRAEFRHRKGRLVCRAGGCAGLAAVLVVTPVLRPVALAAPHSEAGHMTVGVSTNYQFLVNRRNLDPDLGWAARGGIRSIREDVYWSRVQPAAGEWDWSSYDTLFEAAARYHVEVLPILGYGAAWATGTDRNLPVTDQARTAFAAFGAAVVRRYGANGAFWSDRPKLRRSPITAVEVWNEPWYPGPANPASYVALLQVTADAVRRVQPTVKIVANVDDRTRPTIDGSSKNWTTAVLDVDPDLDTWVDVWGVHPYPRDERLGAVTAVQDSIAQVDYIQSELGNRGLAGDIWITELGFRDKPTERDPHNTPQTAASDFASMIRALSYYSQSKQPNRIARFYAFTLARPTKDSSKSGTWDYGFNLVDAAGRKSPALKRLLQFTPIQ